MAALNTKISLSRWSSGKIEDCEQSIIVSNGAFMWREWTLSYGSPKGTSVLTLNQSLFFSKIGVCFFFENRSLFFENRSLFWKKSELFFENRSLFFSKSEYAFWKSEYWPQILCCHSALEFEQNQWHCQGRGRGVRPPFIFWPKWGPKKLFGDGPPPYLRVWMTAPPPPYLKVF